MAPDAMMERKFDASVELAQKLLNQNSPLLAAFWEYNSDVGRWKFFLVPRSEIDDLQLIKDATALLVQPKFSIAFSVTDPSISSRHIDRVKAFAAHIHVQPYVGRQFDSLFTGNHYFEGVLPVYFAPELMTHLTPA